MSTHGVNGGGASGGAGAPPGGDAAAREARRLAREAAQAEREEQQRQAREDGRTDHKEAEAARQDDGGDDPEAGGDGGDDDPSGAGAGDRARALESVLWSIQLELQRLSQRAAREDAAREAEAANPARRQLFGRGAGVPSSGGMMPISGAGAGPAPRAAPRVGAAALGARAVAPAADAAEAQDREEAVAGDGGMPKLEHTRPCFRGEMDSDALDKWIAERWTDIDYYKSAKLMRQPWQQVTWLSAHLKDAAADWWRSTAKPSGEIVSAELFMAALNMRFRSRLDADVAQEALGSSVRGGPNRCRTTRARCNRC